VVESSKYSAQQLSEDDKEILYKVVIKYAVAFCNIMQEYPNPRDFVKKLVLKAKQQYDKYFATVYTIAYIKNSPSNHMFTPGEINEKLANDIKHSIQQDVSMEIEENESDPKRFLHLRDLREGTLEKLEEQGIWLHFDRKKEIRAQQGNKSRPGKKPSSINVLNDRGGRPSYYLVKEDTEKLKRAMEKPEALDYLYNKVVMSGLAHKIMEYFMLMMFYAIKIDEDVALKLTGAGAIFFKGNMKEQQEIEFKKLYQHLQLVDDNALERYVNEITKYLIHDRRYYEVLFIMGLFRL
jgi:hypothetical protein